MATVVINSLSSNLVQNTADSERCKKESDSPPGPGWKKHNGLLESRRTIGYKKRPRAMATNPIERTTARRACPQRRPVPFAAAGRADLAEP